MVEGRFELPSSDDFKWMRRALRVSFFLLLVTCDTEMTEECNGGCGVIIVTFSCNYCSYTQMA